MSLSKKHFWEWFRRHHTEFLTLKSKSRKDTAYWMNEMSAHLRAYYKFLEYSIVWTGPAAVLTITVDGKAVHFPKVDSLVALAEEIPGWTFAALESPRPIDYFLAPDIRITGIHPDELSFSFANDDPRGVIRVYHPLYTPEKENSIYELARGAIYNLLGERSFGTDIRSIHVANISDAETDELKKLEQLPAYIGLRNSGIVVDGEGKLII